MARHRFGGDINGWTFLVGTGDAATLASATVTFWNSEEGGTQYEDLRDLAGNPITSVTSSDGTDDRTLGQIPPFDGPDAAPEVLAMWAQAGDGPRALIVSSDVAALAVAALGQATTAAANLTTHVSAPNPHGTGLEDLANVDTAATEAATEGQLLAKGADGLWIPADVPGLSGVVDLTTAGQIITGQKVFQSAATTTRLIVHCAPGQVGDVMQFWSSPGTGQGGQAQKTSYANEKGEWRVICARFDSVGVRIKGQPGQTAHVLEQTDTSNNPVSWWEPNGSWRAPNLGHIMAWSAPDGEVEIGTGRHKLRNITGVPLTIRAVSAQSGVAPTGTTALEVDVLLSGVSVFTNPADRPKITSGNTESAIVIPGTTTWPAGASLTVSVLAVGSTTPGEDLVVQVLAY